MAWSDILARVDTLLRELTDPRFEVVAAGEPLSVPADRTVAYWYEGDETDFETLGDANVTELLTVRCYWRLQIPQQLRAVVEQEIRTANRAIKAAIRGDSQLDGNVTDLKLGDAGAGFVEDKGGIAYRVLTIPVRLKVYEAESIVP